MDDGDGSEVLGAGVGSFMTPSKKKVIKSSFMKRASGKGVALKVAETRSSVFAKAGKLSAQDLVRLSEQCSALAMTREREEK